MTAWGNVATLPNNVGIERKDAMRPTLVPPNSPLENKLIDLEQKSLMLGIGLGRFRIVGAGQNAVSNSDQLGGPNWIGCQMSSQSVPVAVIDAYGSAVARQNRIRRQR